VPVDVPNTIDIISTNPKTGEVTLTISDHLDWSEPNEHLLILQDKLNAYLRFIEGDEVVEYCKGQRPPSITVHVAFMHKPVQDAIDFLMKASEIVSDVGASLRYTVHQSGSGQ
jgi:hypothetical protein